jgi:hypothetical protein
MYSLHGRHNMKKILLWVLVALAVGAFTSCVFKGTATVTLHNDSANTITTVNFVAISGGDTDNNSVSITTDETQWFYGIEPGTYRIDIAVDGGGVSTWDASFTVVEGTLYPRIYN